MLRCDLCSLHSAYHGALVGADSPQVTVAAGLADLAYDCARTKLGGCSAQLGMQPTVVILCSLFIPSSLPAKPSKREFTELTETL